MFVAKCLHSSCSVQISSRNISLIFHIRSLLLYYIPVGPLYIDLYRSTCTHARTCTKDVNALAARARVAARRSSCGSGSSGGSGMGGRRVFAILPIAEIFTLIESFLLIMLLTAALLAGAGFAVASLPLLAAFASATLAVELALEDLAVFLAFLSVSA